MIDETLFRAQAQALWGRAQDDMPAWYTPFDQAAEEIGYGYKLYAHAAEVRLAMLVLGDQDIRRDVALLANFGMTAERPLLNIPRDGAGSRRLAAAERRDRALFTHGSVLNERFWWPFFNDCWVLGGVHAACSFHLAMGQRPAADAVWDARSGRPRVLGRELIGLHACGYRRVAHDHEEKLGIVFAPADRGRAEEWTFETLFDAYDRPWSAAEILAIFDEPPLEYDPSGAIVRH
jgi:hypothetical protein